MRRGWERGDDTVCRDIGVNSEELGALDPIGTVADSLLKRFAAG